MKRRDERLKESQRNAEKCRRELRRDRSDLEQREKELVSKGRRVGCFVALPNH